MQEVYKFQMLFDASRSADQNWATGGIINEKFSNDEVPFKYESEDDQIASKLYAMAHMSKNVEGPPVYTVEVSVPVDVFLKSLFEGSIRENAGTNTMFFIQVMHPDNYPKPFINANPMTTEYGEAFLNFGYELLEQDRQRYFASLAVLKPCSASS